MADKAVYLSTCLADSETVFGAVFAQGHSCSEATNTGVTATRRDVAATSEQSDAGLDPNFCTSIYLVGAHNADDDKDNIKFSDTYNDVYIDSYNKANDSCDKVETVINEHGSNQTCEMNGISMDHTIRNDEGAADGNNEDADENIPNRTAEMNRAFVEDDTSDEEDEAEDDVEGEEEEEVSNMTGRTSRRLLDIDEISISSASSSSSSSSSSQYTSSEPDHSDNNDDNSDDNAYIRRHCHRCKQRRNQHPSQTGMDRLSLVTPASTAATNKTNNGRLQRIQGAIDAAETQQNSKNNNNNNNNTDGPHVALQLIAEVAEVALQSFQLVLGASAAWTERVRRPDYPGDDVGYVPGSACSRDTDTESVANRAHCLDLFLQMMCGWSDDTVPFGPCAVTATELQVLKGEKHIHTVDTVGNYTATSALSDTCDEQQGVEAGVNGRTDDQKLLVFGSVKFPQHMHVLADSELSRGIAALVVSLEFTHGGGMQETSSDFNYTDTADTVASLLRSSEICTSSTAVSAAVHADQVLTMYLAPVTCSEGGGGGDTAKAPSHEQMYFFSRLVHATSECFKHLREDVAPMILNELTRNNRNCGFAAAMCDDDAEHCDRNTTSAPKESNRIAHDIVGKGVGGVATAYCAGHRNLPRVTLDSESASDSSSDCDSRRRMYSV